jgi:hypothetical protein
MRTYEPTEQRLRAKVSEDVLERLLKAIEEERARRAAEEAAASRPRAGQDEEMSEPEKSSDEAS